MFNFSRILLLSTRKIYPKLVSTANVTLRNNELLSSALTSKFSTLNTTVNSTSTVPKLLLNPKIQAISNNLTQTRNVIKYSYKKGKRKSVKAVLKRFYRLHWGGWIRTMCGRRKRLWRKSPPRKRRLRQHVLCNGTQSWLLDKMVGKYWREPRYYVDDPYEPYHSRPDFELASNKPRPYFPPENESK